MHKFVCILCRCRPMTVFVFVYILCFVSLNETICNSSATTRLPSTRISCKEKVVLFDQGQDIPVPFNQGHCCCRRRFGPIKLAYFIQDLMDKETLFTTDLCMYGHLDPINFWCINHCLQLQIARRCSKTLRSQVVQFLAELWKILISKISRPLSSMGLSGVG